MNTVAGISNRLLWMAEALGLEQTDVLMLKTPFSFDVSVWELFVGLMVGARLEIARGGGQRDTAYLVETVIRGRVTTIHFVPAMLGAFLGEDGAATCNSLRRVVCSGEALPFELVKRYERVMDATLYNLYGPTEAAVDVTWSLKDKWERTGVVSIGKPIANIGVRIVDRWGETAAIGGGGELLLTGLGVGRGYWGRAAATAEKYVPEEESKEPGGRAYRTGDRCRWGVEGELEYLGRLDDQVKVRGYRIELGEIETALNFYPDVQQVVALVRKDAGSNRLVAYVVAEEGRAPSTTGMKEHLQKFLPEYMVPSIFVVLPALPVTANGKVDRRALLNLQLEIQQTEVEFVAPRDRVEEVVAHIWEQVLRVDRVGIHDSFFDLGGHSITLIEANSKIREALGVHVPLMEMFRHPTIASLRDYITRGDGRDDTMNEVRAAKRQAGTRRQREFRRTQRNSAKSAGVEP
jgi:acyl-coenzyme A synthetase/AMP-(fatty) acid ligase/acyl carrier protein